MESYLDAAVANSSRISHDVTRVKYMTCKQCIVKQSANKPVSKQVQPTILPAGT